ncbi:substrate-binding domain-containing protein [Spirochaeta cellobiosiphila]|uniref:substrate-binding domain-containing protein n=1 Tax=Spirochaeta cellobiosiphila TaxID=504483 RepID=UPI0003F78230|nr:substrate-binding domain-containing protein [Spirochaeta cellobiosiphila]
MSQTGRKRLAYLTRGMTGAGGITTDTARIIWDSLYDTCQQHQCDLITFVGGRNPESEDNFVYELCQSDQVDGIIVWANSIPKHTAALLQHYVHLPIVTLSVKVDDYPVIAIDNKQGIKEIIDHLIQEHGVKKIAFIRGPEGHSYGDERLEAYKESLKAHNIPYDENLVSKSLEWDKKTGQMGVELLLKDRHLKPPHDFQAIMCANDRVAIGVLDELGKYNYNCPKDVIVTGFNNLEEARSFTPSITSVSMPFAEQGRKAVEVLLEMINTQNPVSDVILPSSMIVHESCGCPHRWNFHLEHAKIENIPFLKTLDILEAETELICEEIKKPLIDLDIFTKDMIRQFHEGIVHALKNDEPHLLFMIVDRILEKHSFEVLLEQWYSLLYQYRKSFHRRTSNEETRLKLENTYIPVRGYLTDKFLKLNNKNKMDSALRAEQLRLADEVLTMSQSMDDVVRGFSYLAKTLNFPSAYLVLFPYHYEGKGLPPTSKLGGHISTVDSPSLNCPLIFPTKSFLPKESAFYHRSGHYVIRPLMFGDEKLGYVVYELGPREGTIYESMTTKLSTVLKSALLAEALHQESYKLARANESLLEEQYVLDSFIESVPDLIHFRSTTGEITRANSAYIKAIGYDTHEQVIGKNMETLITTERLSKTQYWEQLILRESQQTSTVEESYETEKGVIWYLTTRMVLKNIMGQTEGFYEISRNITPLKKSIAKEQKVNEELRITQKRLYEAEKMAALSELVVGVAHEINTPIGVCITAASFLDDHMNDLLSTVTDSSIHSWIQTSKDTSHMILDNLRKAADLVQNFKEIAVEQRFEEKHHFDLCEYVKSIIQIMSPQLDKGQHSIELHCEGSLEVDSFPSFINQILSTLILNSINHGFDKKEKGHIDISINKEEKHILVTYKDNGWGMTEDTKNKLFNPFYTTKRNEGHTGLGMNIIYNLVCLRLKGDIKVESEWGRGTTFLITFPV